MSFDPFIKKKKKKKSCLHEQMRNDWIWTPKLMDRLITILLFFIS